MEVFGILGYLFGLRALNEVQKLKEKQETEAVKLRWRTEECPKGYHFNYLGRCSACGIRLN